MRQFSYLDVNGPYQARLSSCGAIFPFHHTQYFLHVYLILKTRALKKFTNKHSFKPPLAILYIMAPAEPVISLSIKGNLSFQLGRNGVAGSMPYFRVKMNDTSRAATLVIAGYDSSTKRFNLTSALQAGVFCLYKMQDNTKVDIPTHDEPSGELVVQAAAKPQWFDLVVAWQDEFWDKILTPGHKYEIRWQDGPNSPWAYHGDKSKDPPEHLPVHHFSSMIELNVLENNSSQPNISLSLKPTSTTCHLNGEPAFGFNLQILSHDKDVITVCFDKTPLKELYGLGDIAHTVDEDGNEVEWPETIGCWGDDDPFPADHVFEELKPGMPYDRTFWLSRLDESTGTGGELDALEPGKSYTVDISKTLIESTFTMWLRGTKEEVLAGSTKEKRARWDVRTGPILLDPSDSFKFTTV